MGAIGDAYMYITHTWHTANATAPDEEGDGLGAGLLQIGVGGPYQILQAGERLCSLIFYLRLLSD